MQRDITRLVIPGGGAKAAGLPASYGALRDTGIYDSIKHISGTSAGALTASLLAIGISPEEFKKTLCKQPFASLLGDSVNKNLFLRDGKPLYELMVTTINKTVLDFLKKQNHSCKKLFLDLQTDNYSFTFGDLKKLHTHWPNKFKKLTIVAVTEQGGLPKVFNWDDTPEVEIASAGRASAAIPGIIESVTINGVRYADGGVHMNIPTNCFDKNVANGTYTNNFKEQTLVITYADGKQDTSGWIGKLRNSFFGHCSIHQALYGTRKQDQENEMLFHNVFCEILSKFTDEIKNNIPQTITGLEQLMDKVINSIYEEHKLPWIQQIWEDIVYFFKEIGYQIYSFFMTLFNEEPVTIQTTNSTSDLTQDSTEEIQQKSVLFEKTIRDALQQAANINSNFAGELEKIIEKMQEKVKAILQEKNKAPVLFNRSKLELMVYNILPRFISNLSTDFKITDKMEEGLQILKKDYPLSTIPLNVGDISAIDFKKADKYQDLLLARGYLDTINHVINHDLFSEDIFAPKQFYNTFLSHFLNVYSKTLEKLNKNIETDELLTCLNDTATTDHHKFHLIKDQAELKIDSDAAFALTKAVMLYRGQTTEEAIDIDINNRVEAAIVSNSRSFF